MDNNYFSDFIIRGCCTL